MSVYLGDPSDYNNINYDDIYQLIAEDLERQGHHRKTVLEIYDFLGTMMIGREESLNDNRLMDWTYPFTKNDPK